MITIEVRGLQETTRHLDEIGKRSASSTFWQPTLREIAEGARKYAQIISPVVTGSYRSAHRVSFEGDKRVTLSVDPTARNAKSGTPVARYACAVEERHQVYARTAAHVGETLDKSLRDLARRLVK